MMMETKKSFAGIIPDYTFFVAHSTEALETKKALLDQIAKWRLAPADPISLLDFGCGDGELLEHLVTHSPQLTGKALALTLIEPVEISREIAIARLNAQSLVSLFAAKKLPKRLSESFHLIIANHTLYYVPDLTQTVARLLATLRSDGLFLVTLASDKDALVQYWYNQFRRLGMKVPYNVHSDLVQVLKSIGASYRIQEIPSQLDFEDTTENRTKIAHFLLGEYLEKAGTAALTYFDRYLHHKRISMPEYGDLFIISS